MQDQKLDNIKAVDIVAPNGVVLTSDVVRVSIKVTPRPAAPAP